jgi:hypothetical protein
VGDNETKKIAWEEPDYGEENKQREIEYLGSRTLVAEAKATARTGSLAVLIDPMLLAGGMTVKEIAGELASKAAEAAKGKDLAANVRARMVSYTRKGWQVIKDDEKRVKLVPKKG